MVLAETVAFYLPPVFLLSPSVRRLLGRELALLLQEPIPAAGKIKERDAKREERIVSKRASPLEPSPRFHQDLRWRLRFHNRGSSRAPLRRDKKRRKSEPTCCVTAAKATRSEWATQPKLPSASSSSRTPSGESPNERQTFVKGIWPLCVIRDEPPARVPIHLAPISFF